MSTSLSLQVTLTPPIIPAFSEPPTVPIRVTLHNPSHTPITVLNWGTPLDPSANVLSIFELRDTTENQPVTLPTIKISRRMPPSAEDLVEIPAGSSVEKEVTLPHVPLIMGHEYSVRVKGNWHSVWESPREDVTAEKLEQLGDAQRGEFSSDVVPLRIKYEG
ncbi:hypothetical protein BDV32DRAFT_146453 [Aspergillus pseudonomiae]|uniref:Uncharacterized protein n=1 Tax=Aspergillus pseudonomiae TaxID=1506151 RepID=A0A5N6IC52_9EURO|nr:uncharacterized protein BDV37DRAFT_238742 [Aspergillus pseudonomiae]KAB8263637.1 hypothetical protein BDV32DRAFT_146453 [Aspergillus pseudonomiae]KAE8408501.1 hypothetical protein BDV37DRAFT_238742 [Aspergillus pseudonomiae]